MFNSLPGFAPTSLEEEREYMVRSFSSSDPNLGLLKSDSMLGEECLLCMEEFLSTHPAATTLCACGMNNRRYHIDCLFRWRNQSEVARCPVCNEELFFDESIQESREEEEEDGL